MNLLPKTAAGLLRSLSNSETLTDLQFLVMELLQSHTAWMT
jgi:hypothetical protein